MSLHFDREDVFRDLFEEDGRFSLVAGVMRISWKGAQEGVEQKESGEPEGGFGLSFGFLVGSLNSPIFVGPGQGAVEDVIFCCRSAYGPSSWEIG